jgi:ribosome-associated protein
MAAPIYITNSLSLDPRELEFTFIRSPGPGGQNVNKVSSAVQLRFALRASAAFPHAMKQRAIKLAGSRMTKDGDIILTASSFRTQKQNREDAVARLVSLLQAAAVPPKQRRKTRPTLASKRRRLEAKSKRGKIKSLRNAKPSLD